MGFTERDVPPDVWAKLTGEAPPPLGGRERRPQLAAPAFEPPGTWVVPCEVPSLANGRDWRVRNRVAQAHRRAVSRALGPHLRHLAPVAEHYHAGGAVRCVLTRLGGRKLDATANLGASLKYVEDAVALLLGADDGDPRWRCEPRQEPGGAVGVRIELAVASTEPEGKRDA